MTKARCIVQEYVETLINDELRDTTQQSRTATQIDRATFCACKEVVDKITMQVSSSDHALLLVCLVGTLQCLPHKYPSAKRELCDVSRLQEANVTGDNCVVPDPFVLPVVDGPSCHTAVSGDACFGERSSAVNRAQPAIYIQLYIDVLTRIPGVSCCRASYLGHEHRHPSKPVRVAVGCCMRVI
jgi:hypothetical protein